MHSNKAVGVVGGGIAGLYAALLLRREGHRVTVFEASDRVGGRIYTRHFQNLDNSEDVYFEAGAMRIPRSSLHRRVYQLIRYLNTHGSREDKVELIQYTLEHENNVSFVLGQKLRPNDCGQALGFDFPTEFRGKSARTLLGEVVAPWLEALRSDFDRGFAQLLTHDELSFRQYLRLVPRWPHEVIDFVELMSSQTNQYDLSFTEIIMQNLDFDTKDWTTVRNGMSRLPESAAHLLGGDVQLCSPITGITECADGRVALTSSAAGQQTEIFDKVILAMPPSALHSIIERPNWPVMKQQFIRGAHLEPLYKMGLHFRTRFWEQSSSPSFGGQSVTDLRFRWIVYPSNDLGTSGSGVLLLYCWMTDASRWQTIPREKRIELALHDLQEFFSDTGIDVYEQFITADDVMWSCEYASGDAMFLPGQFSRYHNIAGLPEGNVHFAGEHLSKHHTWIAGAIDSAVICVRDLLGRSDLPALGEEYFASVEQTQHIKMDGVPRHYAYAIPHHNNLQYVQEIPRVLPLKS